MPQPILTIEDLSLRAEKKLVLKGLNLSLPPTGMTALMGPVGTGKSSLVKWLCGRADPAVYQVGHKRAVYFNQPLSYRNRPPLYGQRQAQTLEQMMLHLSVLLSTNPALLCVDEPTADLSPQDSAQVMERLAMIARGRAVFVVSHKQAEMQRYSDQVMLLAGGDIKETAQSQEFFSNPRTEAGKQFVGTGWVGLAGLDTPSHHLNHEHRETSLSVAVAPLGADGRLSVIVPDKLYFYHLPDDPSALVRDADELRARGLQRLVSALPPGSEAGAVWTGRGLAISAFPALAVQGDFTATRAGCQSLLTEFADTALTIVGQPGHAGSLRAIGQLLICMGVPANSAAEAAAAVAGNAALDPLLEQELWDFELSGELERDGFDPDSFRVGPSPINYSEVAPARARRISPSLPIAAPVIWRAGGNSHFDHGSDRER